MKKKEKSEEKTAIMRKEFYKTEKTKKKSLATCMTSEKTSSQQNSTWFNLLVGKGENLEKKSSKLLRWKQKSSMSFVW